MPATPSKTKPDNHNPSRFKVQRKRFSREYELDKIEQIGDDVAVVIAHPVYKDGKGRPRTIGHLKLHVTP